MVRVTDGGLSRGLRTRPMPDGCIFCGSTPLTKEHLWPDWLRRKVELGQPFEHRIEDEIDGVEARDVTFMTPPFKQVVKAVCGGCNGGWMSAIEAAAKPILLDLIYARGRMLDPDDQRRLATWAFLKACVLMRCTLTNSPCLSRTGSACHLQKAACYWRRDLDRNLRGVRGRSLRPSSAEDRAGRSAGSRRPECVRRLDHCWGADTAGGREPDPGAFI